MLWSVMKYNMVFLKNLQLDSINYEMSAKWMQKLNEKLWLDAM